MAHKEKQKKKSKWKKRFIKVVLLIILILIFLMWLNTKGGSGFFWGSTSGANDSTTLTSDASTDVAKGNINISIQETMIMINDESYTLDELEEFITTIDKESMITLIDANAIKATYEEVIRILNEMDIHYTISEESRK